MEPGELGMELGRASAPILIFLFFAWLFYPTKKRKEDEDGISE